MRERLRSHDSWIYDFGVTAMGRRETSFLAILVVCAAEVYAGSSDDQPNAKTPGITLKEYEESERAHVPTPRPTRHVPTYFGLRERSDVGLIELPEGEKREVSKGDVVPQFGKVTALSASQICFSRRLNEPESRGTPLSHAPMLGAMVSGAGGGSFVVLTSDGTMCVPANQPNSGAVATPK